MMRKLAALLVLGLVLQGCGNTPDRADTAASIQALKQLPAALFRPRGAPDPAQMTAVRQALEADGKPVISVTVPSLRYAALMVPYYPSKGGALTWSSPTYETVTLKEGVLQSTRGLGPDLMASASPDIGQVSRGSGSFHRIYEYLDGGDVPRQLDYDCDFAPGGAQKVTVLDQSYDTRLVVETCSKGADRFENRYWFDGGGKIRQSEQRLAPGVAPMLIQRIIE